jgi:transaldolase/glucose-6-phosphate isomerase
VDAIVGERLKASKDQREQEQLKSILGSVAIANGKQTYVSYQKLFSGDRWKALATKGAQTQRVLWASTSTKNPNYRDVLYVEELIGPDTVNTIPPATLDAFRDHGRPRPSLTEDIESANRTMETVAKVGISMKEVTDKLTDDGVRLFAEAFDKLLKAVEKSSK